MGKFRGQRVRDDACRRGQLEGDRSKEREPLVIPVSLGYS